MINLNSNFIAVYDGKEVVIYSDKVTSFTKSFVANSYGHEDTKFIKIDMRDTLCIGGEGRYSQKDNSSHNGCKYILDIPNLKITYNSLNYDFFSFSSIYLEGKELKIINNENGRFGLR